MNHKIILSANTSWYLYNFRLSLIQRLQQKGITLFVIAPEDAYSNLLQDNACHFYPIALDNKGTNPFREFQTILNFRRIYNSIRPSLILHYTPKPNIYGSLAARSLNMPCINNIAGLGTAFIKSGWLSHIVRLLYRLSLRGPQKVFFQNPDDFDFFVQSGLVKQDVADLLPGSGVDVKKFAPETRCQVSGVSDQEKTETRQKDEGRGEANEVIFLLIARLIWDKGVGQYAEAAKLIKAKYPESQFQLLGFVDHGNPAAVPEKQIRDWESEGILNWLGRADDVRPHISTADCVVLPSYYREGTPKTLLEAAAMAKPIITTDAIGCRQTVDDGVTGFLCEPRNAKDLAQKMEWIIKMGSKKRQEMGRKGRQKMVREFDENIVIEKYMQAIHEILAEKK